MKHHPDQGGDENKFKEVNEAYARIKNPEKFLDETTPGGFSFRRGGNVEDIFEEFFGFHKRQRPKMSVQMSLWVTLEEVLHGTTQLISVSTGSDVKAVKVRVPQAVKDGGRVKYAGVGPNGADVYITFRIHPHKRFDRISEFNIQTWQDINFWDLILGTTIPVSYTHLTLPTICSV